MDKRTRLSAAAWAAIWHLSLPGVGAAEDSLATPRAASGAEEAAFDESITVTAASRRREALLDAPAAVTVVDGAEAARRSTSGELARSLAGTAGVELHASGVGVYELNVRGFGGDYNRRVAIVVDGRDVATPVSGSYEWNLLSNLIDLAEVEFVRGPASALYGANAYNGVLSVVTRPAAEGGGRLRVALGDPTLRRADLSWARPLGARWHAKLTGSAGEWATFARSRDREVEYAGLPLEAIPLPRGRNRFEQLGLRFDRELARGLVSLEGGRSSASGALRVSGSGRLQTVAPDERTWARLAADSGHLRIVGSYTKIDIPDRTYLSFGSSLAEHGELWRVEASGERAMWNDRGLLVAGATYGESRADSAGPGGVQTFLAAPFAWDERAVFAQLDLRPAAAWRLVAAARWDDSSAYDVQWSHKLGVIWSPTPDQRLRFTYSEGFQEPNAFELSFDLPSFVPSSGGFGPQVDLSAVELAHCVPYGVDCGFGSPVPARQRGNEGLAVEEVATIEAGYSLRFAGEGAIDLAVYRSELTNFITESLPNPFGATNPAYGAYRPPAAHPVPSELLSALVAALGDLYPFLTLDADGSPLLVTDSVSNAARVETRGAEVAARAVLGGRWRLRGSATWFDFRVVDRGVGGELVANAPEWQGSLEIAYQGDGWEAWASGRSQSSFRWAIGDFDGRVPAFEVLSAGGAVQLRDAVELRIEIDNLLDDDHIEIFGGERFGRRVLASLDLSW